MPEAGAPDPWRWERWAFQQVTGNPTRKAVLSMLAMMADANTGRCEAKQDTIAQGVEASERSVRTHLAALEQAGFIARRAQVRRDRGRRGDEFLLLAPWVTEWPDGEQIPDHPATLAGGSPGNLDTPPTVRPASGQELPPMNDHASGLASCARPREDEIPEDFPDELRPHARRVMAVLKEAASERGADAVTVRAVGRAVMDHPRKSLVATAQDLRAWLLDGKGRTRPCKDVVRRYRDWLRDAPDLEAIERLADDGTPANGHDRPQAGVTHLRPNASAEERRMARQRERAAKIAEYDRAEAGAGHNAVLGCVAYPTTEER